jgi:hypothetical protein
VAEHDGLPFDRHFRGLHGGVQTFEDRLIHLLGISKRAIAVAEYVAMPEMKICGELYVRHKSL